MCCDYDDKEAFDHDKSDNNHKFSESLEPMIVWSVQGFEQEFVRCLVFILIAPLLIHSCCDQSSEFKVVPFLVLGRHSSTIPAASAEDESKVIVWKSSNHHQHQCNATNHLLYATWLSPEINQILAQMTHSCRSGRVSDSTCQEVSLNFTRSHKQP